MLKPSKHADDGAKFGNQPATSTATLTAPAPFRKDTLPPSPSLTITNVDAVVALSTNRFVVDGIVVPAGNTRTSVDVTGAIPVTVNSTEPVAHDGTPPLPLTLNVTTPFAGTTPLR